MKENNLTFEEALKELEEISNKLETGDIPLDKSVEYFERGIKLSEICADKLNSAKQKIITLTDAESEEEKDGE